MDVSSPTASAGKNREKIAIFGLPIQYLFNQMLAGVAGALATTKEPVHLCQKSSDINEIWPIAAFVAAIDVAVVRSKSRGWSRALRQVQ